MNRRRQTAVGQSQGRIRFQPVRLVVTISVIFGSKISLRVYYCKRYKSIDDRMALYRECCFPNVQNRGE